MSLQRQNSNKPFHDHLEHTRQRAGLSHDQLAHRAWTSPSYTHRLCAGKAKPGRDTVIRLGVALNLAVDEVDELLRLAGHLGLLEVGPVTNNFQTPTTIES